MSRTPLHGRDAYRHWTRISTRWADNDVYGHVNNTVHYQWFDSAVNAWLIERGLLDVDGSDADGPIGLVVETGCRYAAPLRYPGDVDIGLALDRMGGSSVTYRMGVFAAGDDLPAAEGRFTHVYVGRDDRRPVPLPAGWRTIIATLGVEQETV